MLPKSEIYMGWLTIAEAGLGSRASPLSGYPTKLDRFAILQGEKEIFNHRPGALTQDRYVPS